MCHENKHAGMRNLKRHSVAAVFQREDEKHLRERLRGKEARRQAVWILGERGFLGRGSSLCKGPGAGPCPAFGGSEACVAGAESVGVRAGVAGGLIL